MQMLTSDEFSVSDRAALATALHGAAPLFSRAHDQSHSLTEAGLTETAELIARLADRLVRQEQLLLEERNRSAALELQLASKQTAVAV